MSAFFDKWAGQHDSQDAQGVWCRCCQDMERYEECCHQILCTERSHTGEVERMSIPQSPPILWKLTFNFEILMERQNKLVSPISTSLCSLPHMSYFRSPSIHTFLDLLAHLFAPIPSQYSILAFPDALGELKVVCVFTAQVTQPLPETLRRKDCPFLQGEVFLLPCRRTVRS